MNEKIFSQWEIEFNTKNFSKAVKILEVENKNHPDDLQCLYHLGFTWRFIGDFEKAEKYYLEALQIAPNDDSVTLGLGVVYQMKGDLDKAIKYLEKTIASRQFDANAFNSLGLTYKKKGDLDKAVEIYMQGIKHLFDEIYINLSKQYDLKHIPHQGVSSDKWIEFAMETMIKATAKTKIKILAWPTGEQALKFYKETKDAPCWTDAENKRMITPQYVEAVREYLSKDLMYSILTNNLGVIFGEKNKIMEAKKWFQESIAFIPEGVNYPNPKIGLEAFDEELSDAKATKESGNLFAVVRFMKK